MWARGQLDTRHDDDADQEAEFDDALAVFGLSPESAPGEPEAQDRCYLWPCNVRVWNIWHRIQTQWRTGGMGGRTGLDYDALATYLRQVERIRPTREWGEIWIGLQAMECAALDEWAKKSSND